MRTLIGGCAAMQAIPALAATPPAPPGQQLSAYAISLINAPIGRTYKSGSTASPLSLLAAPADPVAYYETKVRTRALIDAKKFAEAEPLAQQLVDEYPVDPENWQLLADAQQEIGKHLESAYSNARAGQLRGWDLGFAHGLWMAANFLAGGDKPHAMETLRRLIADRHFYWRSALYEMDEFKALRDDAEFKTLTGHVDASGWNRSEGYRHDLDFLIEEVKRVNPDYRDKPFPPEVIRRYEALKAAIPTLSEEQFYVGLLRVLAPLDQGHMFLAPGKSSANRWLPLRLYAFPEGLFIIDAEPAYKDLVGSRILKFGGLGADEALRRIGDAHGMDSEMGRVYLASYLAASYFIVGLGSASGADSIELEVQAPGAAPRTIALKTQPGPQGGGRWDILVAPPSAKAPLFLDHMEKKHFIQRLPKRNALYVRLNNVLPDERGHSLDQLADRLRRELAATRAANLILDVRQNNGGVTQTYPRLMVALANFGQTPGKKLYVIIGRRTYSAAGNLITDLDRLAKPIFVGERSGECCNLYGDPTRIVLPYTGIQGELTAVKWQLSEPGDRRRDIAPAIPVQLHAADYFAGRDPVLDAIFKIIAKSRAETH